VLPLAVSNGAGAGGQNAIGRSVVGGMMTATFLAIFFVPVFFLVVKKLFRQEGGSQETAPPSLPSSFEPQEA
jgi:HAE1 family hydrophobic/amphiphilic exporter-1/multidrug efflux pump